jgi:hypothetical protein
VRKFSFGVPLPAAENLPQQANPEALRAKSAALEQWDISALGKIYKRLIPLHIPGLGKTKFFSI